MNRRAKQQFGRAGLLVVLAGLTLLPAQAQAGRRPYFWTWDTEVLAERGVEVEQWLTERYLGNGNDVSSVWTAPILGITDRLELALPLEWSWRQAKKETQFDWYGAELRWRLADPDPAVAGPFTTLVRVAVHRPVRVRDELRFEANLVASYEFTARCKATADVGGLYLLSGKEMYLTYAAGTSCTTVADLRVGAELFGEVFVKTQLKAVDMTMVGPNLGWTHGRFWLTAGVLFGVTDAAPFAMSRLIWAANF